LRRRCRAAAASLLKAEFHVLLELAELLFQLPVLELQLLDLAGQRAHLPFHAAQAEHEFRGILCLGARAEPGKRQDGKEGDEKASNHR
jgi:hypothetical protein